MRITKTHIIWNFLGSIINNGLSIFILPIILNKLSSSELGLWYVFGSIASLVNLVDFGFSPTIMRNITYAYGGAKTLLVEGISKETLNGKPNYDLVFTIIKTSKKIYLGISIFAAMIMISFGTIYIKSVSGGLYQNIIWAWLIYTLAVFINLYYSYWNPVLKGIGGIKQINQALLLSRIIYLIIASIALLSGYNLIGLSIAYLISGIVMRCLARHYYTIIIGFSTRIFESLLNVKDILKIIWPNAKKSGIVTIGAWLITKSTTLLCSSFIGLEETAKYGLSLQLITFIIAFSKLLFTSYVPELAYLGVTRDEKRYKIILSRGVVVQWLTGFIGLGVLIILGNWLLVLIGSSSTLLSPPTLMLLCIISFLENNHSTFATVITLSNSVPFVKASLYSGLAIVFLGYLILKFTSLGLLGLIIVQGIVQLAYNNWYWPHLVLKKENLTPIRMLQLAVSRNVQ